MFFKIKTYSFASAKIHRPLRMLVLADLHGRAYPPLFGDLAGVCADRRPDLILVPGDTVTAREDASFLPAEELLCSLTKLCPVYMSNGNHETKLRMLTDRHRDRYRELVRTLKNGGVHILNNASEDVCQNGNRLRVSGLEIPLSSYKKFRRPKLSSEGMARALGRPGEESLNILLAHNPAFAEQYFAWGADLTVSGHFHGGIVRSPFTGRALMDPYGFPLPKYGYGMYRQGEKRLIVSGGLGDHFLLPRLFNPRELVEIRVLPKKRRKSHAAERRA